MAVVASGAMTGAQEALASCDDVGKPRPSPGREKKYDAFIMNGEAMISLNGNISSMYAKIAKDQLPPNTQIAPSMTRYSATSASAGVSFPSMKRNSARSRLPVSVSQPEGVRRVHNSFCQPKDEPDNKKMFVEPEEPLIAVGQRDSAESEEKENEAVNVDSLSSKDVGGGSFVASYAESPSSRHTTEHEDLVNTSSSAKSASTTTSPRDLVAAESPAKQETSFDNVKKPLERSPSSNTFVITFHPSETHDGSPAKDSTVVEDETAFVTAIEGTPRRYPGGNSVSAANSPSLRRILGAATASTVNSNSGTPTTAEGSRTGLSYAVERCASMRSDVTGGVGADLPPGEEREATILAARLFYLRGYTSSDVADKLNEQSDFSLLVLMKYLEMFQFSNKRIDAALREFLSRLELRGESSQRERLLRLFSSRYYDCNPALFPSLDDVHTLTCALLLLNSDLHGPNGGRKMSTRDFITNIAHTGSEYKRDLLKALYLSIKDQAIVLGGNNQGSEQEMSLRRRATLRQSMMQSTFEVDPDTQVEYKSGFLNRKCVYDSDRVKTPFGRRGWRMWYARLRGLVLYFDVDDTPRTRNRYATFSNAILLHHSYAEEAKDYKKRPHVFRLRTANLGEYLFETSTHAELEEWCVQINYVAAAFSSRALPAAVATSQGSFSRPRLPRIPSIAPLSQQLKAHEAAATDLRNQMERVQRDAPLLTARGKSVEDYFFSERCLYHEITRYSTYVRILRHRLSRNGEIRASASCATEIFRRPEDSEDVADNVSYKQAVLHKSP